jgi:HlyD family secretion protein
MKTIPRPLLIGAGGRARRLRRLLRLVALARRPDRCGLVSGNGRIEATEIDVATKLPGRVTAMLVDEGDFVKAGQPLARMDVVVLQAQLDEAQARAQQAVNTAASVDAQVAQRRSDKAAAEAVVVQRESELDAATRRLARSRRCRATAPRRCRSSTTTAPARAACARP